MAENNLQESAETPKIVPADSYISHIVKRQANTINNLRSALNKTKTENQKLEKKLKSTQSIDTDITSRHDSLPISESLNKKCLEGSESKLLKDENLKDVQNDINASVKILNEKVFPLMGSNKKIYIQHINAKLQSAMTKLNNLSESSSSKQNNHTGQHSIFDSKNKITPPIIKENSETSSTVQPQSDICGDAETEEKSTHVSSSNYVKEAEDDSNRKCCLAMQATIVKLKKENTNLTSELKEMQLQLDRALSGKLHAEEKVNIYKDQIVDKTKMFEAVMNMQKQSSADSGSLLLKHQLKTFEDNMLSDRDEKLRIQKENDDYKRRLSELESQVLTRTTSSEISSENQQSYASPNYDQQPVKMIKPEPQWVGYDRQQAPPLQARSTRGPQSCVDGVPVQQQAPGRYVDYNQSQQRYSARHGNCGGIYDQPQQFTPRRVIGFTPTGNNINDTSPMMTSPTGSAAASHSEQRYIRPNPNNAGAVDRSGHFLASSSTPQQYTQQQQPLLPTQKIDGKGRGAPSSEPCGSSNQ